MSHGQWLREMIEEERFTSWFQPIVRVSNGAIQGYEALLRGVEKDGSLLTPGHMFQTAADANMMFQLDLAARRCAVETAAKFDIRSQWLFVNFNPTAVYDPSYCLRTTVSACEKLGLDPASIVFEVTETEEVSDMKHLKGILAFYRRAGFRVALDDVGAGYAGLNTLSRQQPDLIKIDRHLVTDIDTDRFKRNIVEHLVALARENDIDVLAEGIETPEVYQVIQDLNIDFAQGFHLAKPAPEPISTLESAVA